MSSIESAVHSKGVTTLSDSVLPPGEYSDLELDHFRFTNFSGAECHFKHCSFRYCIFEDSYFRKATFSDCNFTGARFIRSNLRKVKFTENCTLNYAFFTQTWVDPDQLVPSLPTWINVREQLCRTLRANFAELGDDDTALRFLELELAAAGKHKKATVTRDGQYYTKSEFDSNVPLRMDFRWKWWAHRLGEFTWGHGLRPERLLIFITLALLVVVVLLSMIPASIGATVPDGTVSMLLRSVGDVSFFVGSTFLGLTYTMEPTTCFSRILTVVTAALGYLALGMVVASAYRRLARQ